MYIFRETMAKNTPNSDQDDDEPSIEEILSSIRDIISDEEEEGKKMQKPAEKKAEQAPEDQDDDVLDLTDIVTDDDTGKDVPGEDDMPGDVIEAGIEDNESVRKKDPLAGINLDHPGDDFDISDAKEGDDDDGLADILEQENIEPDMPEEKPEPIERPQTPAPEKNDALLNDIAAAATVSSMSRLAENIAVSRHHDGLTLEDIVRELLRPMLKEWLDSNLPDVIERLVAKELERLAEKAARK